MLEERFCSPRWVIFLIMMVAGGTWSSPCQAASEVILNFDANTDPLSAADSSGNDMHFPYLGESRQSTETAKFGTGSMALGQDAAMGFGGSLAGPPFSDLGEPVSQMTISLWVLPKSDTTTNSPVFFLQRLNGSKEGGFTFSLSGSGQLVFYAAIETDGRVESVKVNSQPTPGLTTGEWTQFAMTFDEGEVTFYFNGEPVGDPQSMPNGITRIPILVEPRLGVLRGLVSSPGLANADDFGFFPERALSPEEIATIYEKGLTASGLPGTQP